MDFDLLKDYALSFVGIPYRWGGDDPINGYDCSGFVQEILAAFGVDPIGDQTAQALYTTKGWEKCSPQLGALAFYGTSPSTITHVALCLGPFNIIEAGGGNSSTLSVEDAAKQNAYIRVRPINRRKDLIGCLLPVY